MPFGNSADGVTVRCKVRTAPSDVRLYLASETRRLLATDRFVEEMLEKLAVERDRHHRYKNLVVAATGTGKTIVAALDYKRLRDRDGDLRLLFVAHRQEILKQSLGAFRQVLRSGDFGELYVDGHRPDEWRHVFASVQSLAQADLEQVDPSAFDVVIVDEFHHAAAPTYRRLLERLFQLDAALAPPHPPRILLGLTATPERTDAEDILHYFDNHIAVELRLWEALERGLLCPFQYFGLHDNTDLSSVRWSRKGYDTAELERVYTGDHARVNLVLAQVSQKHRHAATMRALGFCVSIAHAQFMAQRFTEAGLPSLAVSKDTDSHSRAEALTSLRAGLLRALFAVDLFNEGVDLPEVDTLLFLRPTESALVFLQQTGRRTGAALPIATRRNRLIRIQQHKLIITQPETLTRVRHAFTIRETRGVARSPAPAATRRDQRGHPLARHDAHASRAAAGKRVPARSHQGLVHPVSAGRGPGREHCVVCRLLAFRGGLPRVAIRPELVALS